MVTWCSWSDMLTKAAVAVIDKLLNCEKTSVILSCSLSTFSTGALISVQFSGIRWLSSFSFSLFSQSFMESLLVTFANFSATGFSSFSLTERTHRSLYFIAGESRWGVEGKQVGSMEATSQRLL